MNLWIISIAMFCVGVVARSIELHHHDAEHARARDVADADAADLLGMVHNGGACAAFVSGAARRRHPVAARSSGRHQLLHSGRTIRERPARDPSFQHTGGSPILWQHLFWFFGHPEVYIAILPGMGVTSHILSTFARKPVFGYRAMVYAIFAIGLLGFFVWGHHMFISGMSPYSAMAFSILTLIDRRAFGDQDFQLAGHACGAGRIRFTTPMLFAIGFVSLFVSGGITGSVPGSDFDRHSAARHLLRGRALPSDHGRGGDLRHVCRDILLVPQDVRQDDERRSGQDSFLMTFVGVNAIFIPMHIMGMAGQTRRYSFHWNPVTGEGLHYLSNMTPLTRFVSYCGFYYDRRAVDLSGQSRLELGKGPKASDNPWEATSLEWMIPSPPPHDNFAGIAPEVYRGPYEYSVPGAPKDYTDADRTGRSRGAWRLRRNCKLQNENCKLQS